MIQLRINIGGNYVMHFPDDPDFSVDTKPLRANVRLPDGSQGLPGAPWVLHKAAESLLHSPRQPGAAELRWRTIPATRGAGYFKKTTTNEFCFSRGVRAGWYGTDSSL